MLSGSRNTGRNRTVQDSSGQFCLGKFFCGGARLSIKHDSRTVLPTCTHTHARAHANLYFSSTILIIKKEKKEKKLATGQFMTNRPELSFGGCHA